jgi:hypothetical protein
MEELNRRFLLVAAGPETLRPFADQVAWRA